MMLNGYLVKNIQIYNFNNYFNSILGKKAKLNIPKDSPIFTKHLIN